MKDRKKELEEKLGHHISGKKQSLKMLSGLLLSILKMGSISYSKLSLVLNPWVKNESNFKRIQRFIKAFLFKEEDYVALVWSLCVKEHNWVALSIDRTNWKFGKKNINVLMLGISYQGTCIPLVWKLLDKRGNSSYSERMALIEKLLNSLDSAKIKQIKCLLADREFIGNEWISYLKSLPFDFVIRIRNNSLIRKKGSLKSKHAYKIFSKKRFVSLRKKRMLYGHELFVGGEYLGVKKQQEEWLVLISNVSLSQGKRGFIWFIKNKKL